MSRESKDNHNKFHRDGDGCPYQSPPDKTYCADVIRMTASLDNDPAEPKRRFKQLTTAEVASMVRVIEGPQTHWLCTAVDDDAGFRNVTVTTIGWTKAQKWAIDFPVEEYRS